jgi:hypothetical protein
MNPDCSFGTLDVPFSTSLAILALADLGLRGRLLQMAQLRLLDFVAVDGTLPAATPFYSTLLVQQEQESLAHVTNSSTKRWPARIVPIDNELHAISFYFDHHKMITTAVGALALSIEYQASAHGLILDEMVRQRLESHPRCHPRYQCHTHEEYIQRFALPPYSLSKATNELHPSIEKQT